MLNADYFEASSIAYRALSRNHADTLPKCPECGERSICAAMEDYDCKCSFCNDFSPTVCLRNADGVLVCEYCA